MALWPRFTLLNKGNTVVENQFIEEYAFVADHPNKSETLGDKLDANRTVGKNKFGNKLIVAAIIGLIFWGIYQTENLAIEDMVLMAIFAATVIILGLVISSIFKNSPISHPRQKQHFLFVYDQQKFMRSLELQKKTAIFDGSNIYHFGLDNNIGAGALAGIIARLRSENYRIICFFDANIFYTLKENGDLDKLSHLHSIPVLQLIFGLAGNEIYVVPSRTQADKFIVETLTHMPVSFAVTNDRFRDYAADYDVLAQDNSWRKGVRVKGGELKLYQHKFSKPLRILTE